MASLSPASSHVPRRWLMNSPWRLNPALAVLVVGSLAALIVFIVGIVVDPRVITGAPAWLKPAKFAVSIAIYGATLLWLLTFVRDRPRLVAIISVLVALGFGIEMVLIALQAFRGTTSHFNVTTSFDAAVFGIMGAVITGVWLLTAVVAALLFRRQFASPAIVWGVRLGLLIALVGMAIAFRMPQPTPQQETLMDSTGSSLIIGAHTVGFEDGGPGMPIVGWSTEGGDLRIAHFVGLHALQVLPLLGWLLTRYAPAWISATDRARIVRVAGALWLALTLLVLWQALRGQPLIRPDQASLSALLGSLGVALVSVIVILVHSRSAANTNQLA